MRTDRIPFPNQTKTVTSDAEQLLGDRRQKYDDKERYDDYAAESYVIGQIHLFNQQS